VLVVVVLLALALVVASVALVLQVREVRRLRVERDRLESELQRARQPRGSSRRRVSAVKAVMESAVEGAVRLREQGVTGLLTSSIEDLSRWASEDRELDRYTGPDGTVTILFSDIEDSTVLNDQLGDKEWVRLLGAHDRVVRDAVERHGGHIVKSQGDGFMIVFREPANAVRAGIDVQDALGSSRRASGSHRKLRKTPIRVRVGIHSGTVVEKDGDYFGTNVAMAARVAAMAKGGEILVSDRVRHALRDADDAEDVVLVDARETELKGLPGTHRLWQVALI
jgi:class 3 adenylate cyclase